MFTISIYNRNHAASLDYAIGWMYKGRVDYAAGLYLQEELYKRVLSNGVSRNGFLILVEHNPVITIGRFGEAKNILISEADMRRRGIEFHRTDRGGDVTFHAPGQIVGYPIINLRSFRLGVKSYVRLLEQTLIRVLQRYGIEGKTREGYPGVWVRGEKIASIGVSVKNGVTRHGFALNVNTDLSWFSLIVPCGIKDVRVSSIKEILEEEVPLSQAASDSAREFGNVLGTDMKRFDVPV